MEDFLDVPYKQGRVDYRKGFSKTLDNPYMPGTLTSGAWRKGWEDEFAENLAHCGSEDD